LAWLVSPDAFENRASGVIANPNFLGAALSCGIAWIIGTAAWLSSSGRADRAVRLVAFLPLPAIALLLSFSRAAIAGLGVGLVAVLATRSLRVAAAIAAAGLLAAVLIYPLFIQVRLGQTFGTSTGSGQAAFDESDRLRALMAEAAVRAFIDAPATGHGFATFNEISPRYSGQSVLTSAHNLYLKVAAEQGLVGLALLAALLAAIAIPLWQAGRGPWIAALGVLGAFATFSLTADSLSSAQTVATAFFLMAAGVAEAAVARERLLATHPVPSGSRLAAGAH
jgi:O-antigen ligase